MLKVHVQTAGSSTTSVGLIRSQGSADHLRPGTSTDLTPDPTLFPCSHLHAPVPSALFLFSPTALLPSLSTCSHSYCPVPCPLGTVSEPAKAAPQEIHPCPAGGQAQPLRSRGRKGLLLQSKEPVGAKAGVGPGLCPDPTGREHGRSPLPSLLWQVLKPLPPRKALKRRRQRILRLHEPACQSWLFQHMWELEEEATSRTQVGLQDEPMEVDVVVEEDEAMDTN
ncbi:uncharacterized protein LOC133226433 [Neopsephotus bourkii]|uniref:uncharacterized protein LOC133226433 n=1 Tax=Neopsephotus bourkii TaxID=309878 RepID=UPI002AA5916E|nr:uncharacterized protein LOC133226433 [Neopsephotus bourkii]